MFVKIYEATNSGTGEVLSGTQKELADALGRSDTTIRFCAKTGAMTSSGWTIRFVQQTYSRNSAVRPYYASCPGEDPIVGPISEIAALTGLSERYLRDLYHSGKASKSGWRIRKAQPGEL